MAEAEGAPAKARSVRTNQLLACQRLEGLGDGGPCRVGDRVGDGCLVKDLAHDGGPLDHGAFVLVQPVEASCEERLDRRRHANGADVAGCRPVSIVADEQTVVDQHQQHLLDEQRVALGGLSDPRLDLLGKTGAAEKVPDQEPAFIFGERFEERGRRVQLPAGPAWASLEQLGPAEADEQDGRVARAIGQVLDQVQEGGFPPVNIVEDDHQRAELARGPRKARPPS